MEPAKGHKYSIYKIIIVDMLVKAFNDFKETENLEKIESEVKKLTDYKAKDTRKKIQPFEDFLADAYAKENGSVNEMKYLSMRDKFLNENKAQKVLKQLNSGDLPEADGLDCKNSQVGSFISADEIVELYGDEYEGILDQLGKEGMLMYSWGNEHALWQRKKDDEADGMVRIV